MEVQIGNNEKEIPIEIDIGFTKSSTVRSSLVKWILTLENHKKTLKMHFGEKIGSSFVSVPFCLEMVISLGEY